MRIDEFNQEELQWFRCAVPYVQQLALYFEGDYQELCKELSEKTVPPVKFVKEYWDNALFSTILLNGYKISSKKLGVSVEYLKNIVQDKLELHQHLPSKDMFELYESEVESLAKRIPYSSLFKKCTGLNLRLFESKVPEVKSNLQTYKGNISELFYKKLRGSNIIKDMNEEDSHSKYDFDDKEYGRVNVKSSKIYKYSDGSFYWKFSTSGEQDTLGLVGWDNDFENPMFVAIVINDFKVKSFSCTAEYIRDLYNNKISALLFISDRLKRKPDTNGN